MASKKLKINLIDVGGLGDIINGEPIKIVGYNKYGVPLVKNLIRKVK